MSERAGVGEGERDVQIWLALHNAATPEVALQGREALMDALTDAVAHIVAERVAAAEQRGREDNADHGMCYVHGSKALEARLAAAWDEGYDAGYHDTGGPNPYIGDLTASTAEGDQNA